jgi:hypothetical protein
MVIAVGRILAVVSPDKETSLMKLGCRVLALLVSVAFLGGCGPSQADYDRAKKQYQIVSTERDNLKSQLEQATAKIETLSQQVATLQAAATAKPDPAAEAAKATASKGSKKKQARAKSSRKSKKRA